MRLARAALAVGMGFFACAAEGSLEDAACEPSPGDAGAGEAGDRDAKPENLPEGPRTGGGGGGSLGPSAPRKPLPEAPARGN